MNSGVFILKLLKTKNGVTAMEYIITQFNFWDLARFYARGNDTFYYKEMPSYLTKWFRNKGIKIVKSLTRPPFAELTTGSYSDWPKENELRDDITIRKFHIDDDNYDFVIASLKRGDQLVYTDGLTRELPEGIEAKYYPKGSTDVPKEKIVLTGFQGKTTSNLNEYVEDAEIIHFLGNVMPTIQYRRHRLNSYLKNKYKVTTVYKGVVNTKGAKALIVSDPRGCQNLVADALVHNVPIFYDRTDNWNALYPHVEDYVINHSAVVTCSSKWLFDDTESIKKVLIENAADPFEYKETTKENIAVYVGKATGKTDNEFCTKLRAEHPDFKFVSIGAKVEGFEHLPLLPKDVMMGYLSHCKIGLVPLKNEAYFKGQFNLKVWDYINAKMPVLVTDDYNYKNVKNVHTEWTTDFIPEDVPLWTSAFERMEEIWQPLMNPSK